VCVVCLFGSVVLFTWVCLFVLLGLFFSYSDMFVCLMGYVLLFIWVCVVVYLFMFIYLFGSVVLFIRVSVVVDVCVCFLFDWVCSSFVFYAGSRMFI